ncbi:very short patch repair endonuclease [Betaproteobacteria bacterium PRO7]|jgi:DNA mismatch endonuclease (patch repair protein)|nr:very short patch repair endonuclease [Betaproteobacteria bacterium PRO7]
MSRIRGRETGPEIALRRELWRMGLRYRTHAKLPGRPDVAFLGDRLAVFIDGCFWHSCPLHGVSPKENRDFWERKLQGNRARDRRNERDLTTLGWSFVRFWEHEIDEAPDRCARAVARALRRKRRSGAKRRRGRNDRIRRKRARDC